MVGLPKSIIKKYGVTKKAWAVFRGTKSKSRPSGQERKTMARRRGVKRRFGRHSAGLSVKDLAVGTAAVSVFEPFLDNLAGNFAGGLLGGIGDDVIKAGLGWYLAKKQKGAIKGAGYALLVIGVRNIVAGFAGPMMGRLTGGQQAT